MSSSPSRRGGAVWWAATLGVGGVTTWLLLGSPRRIVWESPLALFWIVTVAAGLCVVGAVVVLVEAHRRALAEVGILGAGLFTLSALPLVHGLTAPGVLYPVNAAVMTSVYVALPLSLVVMSPLAFPEGALSAAVGRCWRAWSFGWSALVTSVAIGLLVRPDAVTVPGPGHPLTLALVVFGVGGALLLSRHQLRLYRIGERPATLVASIAFVLLAMTSLVWTGGPAFGIGWWAVHALDIAGVLGAIGGIVSSHRVRRPVLELFEPVVARDPLRALELGLSPVVHRFVASLEAKDPITRHHVVRTAELAVRVGVALGLPPQRLRRLGLAALLHDIGKLEVPDELLNKPGRLTEEEFEVVQRHTVDGEAILAGVASLATAAPLVRSHHERIDGTGYPDALVAAAIPLESRIIAVCDGYDAMSRTRQYRQGMGGATALDVLNEHSGSQWDLVVVEALAGLLDGVDDAATDAHDVGDGPLADVGRGVDQCDCVDALPEPVRRELAEATR